MKKLSSLLTVLVCLAITASAQTIHRHNQWDGNRRYGSSGAQRQFTATNEGTGVQTGATSNQSGVYNLPFLPVARNLHSGLRKQAVSRKRCWAHFPWK